MNLKEMYIKNFKRKKAVIVYMADESGRLTQHWAIPDASENTVRLNETSKAIVLHKDKRMLSTKHNIPTYVVHYSNCEPVALEDVKKGYYGTTEFELILNNDMAQKVFKASTKSTLSDEGKIIIVALLVLTAALGYFLDTRITDLKNSIPDPAPIVEVIPDDPEPEEVNPYE